MADGVEAFRLTFSGVPEIGRFEALGFNPRAYGMLTSKATHHLREIRTKLTKGKVSTDALTIASRMYLESLDAELHRYYMDMTDRLLAMPPDAVEGWPLTFCTELGTSISEWEKLRNREAASRWQRILGFAGIKPNNNMQDITDVNPSEAWSKFTEDHIAKHGGKIDHGIVLNHAWLTVAQQLTAENDQLLNL